MDSTRHTQIARNHAKRVKTKLRNYELLFTGLLVSLVLLLVDVVSILISKKYSGAEFYIKSFSTVILFFLFLYYYVKWEKLAKRPIITLQTPDSKGVMVGSGEIKFRIGGDRLIDRIKRFIKNI